MTTTETHPVPTVEEAEANAAKVLKTHPLGTPEAGNAIDLLLVAMIERRWHHLPRNPNDPVRSTLP